MGIYNEDYLVFRRYGVVKKIFTRDKNKVKKYEKEVVNAYKNGTHYKGPDVFLVNNWINFITRQLLEKILDKRYPTGGIFSVDFEKSSKYHPYWPTFEEQIKEIKKCFDIIKNYSKIDTNLRELSEKDKIKIEKLITQIYDEYVLSDDYSNLFWTFLYPNIVGCVNN